MKALSGSPINVSGDVVGKITHKGGIFLNKRDLIYVTTEGRIPGGFAAAITSNPKEDVSVIGNGRLPIICNVCEAEELSDGDVVLINPSGYIAVLYKKGAVGNALFITERCNCACIMCPQPPTNTEIDKTELNLKILSLIDKTTPMLGLTGGEPTILGDRFVKILQECKSRLPRTEINLLSNGITFSNMDFAKKVCAVQHPGLTIDIPLYADTGVNAFLS